MKTMKQTPALQKSRDLLEQEVHALTKSIRDLKRIQQYDTASGLPTRGKFIDVGAAEFQRARRYSHELSVVILNIQGFAEIVNTHGEKAGDRIMTSFGQMCDSAYRSGVDVAGRLSDNEIGVFLPQTNLAGALQFTERLQSLIGRTPIQLDKGMVRLGVLYAVDAIQSDDYSFMQCLRRAKQSVTKRLT